MAASIQEIAKGLIELPRHQRLTLIRLLLDLDQPGTGEEIEQAWDEEIRARVKAVDEGRVAGIPYETIRKEMAGRFPSAIRRISPSKSENFPVLHFLSRLWIQPLDSRGCARSHAL